MTTRREFARASAATAIASLLPGRALALGYPDRTVHWVDDTAPGGSGDIVARLVGQQLSDKLGQTFVIDNRPGGGGEVGLEVVARAPADGYTLFVINSAHPTHAMLFPTTKFDFERDFEAVAGIAIGPLNMLVHPDVPAKTVAEFIAYAKANPGKVNFASVGAGSPPHLAAELFKMMAGVDLTHVPYRGGALALTDLLAGHVQVLFSNLPARDYLKAGTLRTLGVTTEKRSAQTPDVPAIAETVPGYAATVWFGAGARKGTPPEIVDKLAAAINVALADDKVKSGLAVLDAAPMPLSPKDLAAFMARETDKWAKVIKAGNIKPE
jgi:tripartite-type tricarboxylate transporter receptor subunit TctC